MSLSLADELVFFGGTALARSLVPDGRLSEDIDLLAIGRRRDVVGAVERQLVQGVRREYPGLRWEPPLSAVRDVEPAVLRAPDGTTVRVQLLAPTGVAPWPVELRDPVQRYSDAPPARLRVPTAASFAAWKMIAWLDRAAARDLYDLWSLAQIDAIDELAVDLFVRHGPTGRPPSGHRFEHPPDEIRWRRDLAGQVQLDLTAVEAFEQVRLAWRRAIGQQ